MQVEPPLITTIIPTYRRPQLLKRAIDSVLNQTYPNFQVCVYDNASGDETAEVVAQIARQDSRVKYFCHSENIGAAKNFDYGMRQVKTEYFSFLSDDDILLPNFFEDAIKEFADFPDIAFYAGSVIMLKESGEVDWVPFDQWESAGYHPAQEGMLDMIAANFPIWTGTLFHKKSIENVGFLDIDVQGPLDVDYLLRVASVLPYVIGKQPCAILVMHAGSLSTIGHIDAMWPGWIKLTTKIVENAALPQNIRTRAAELFRICSAKSLFLIGLKAIQRKDFASAHRAASYLSEYRNNPRYLALKFLLPICKIDFFRLLAVNGIYLLKKLTRNSAKLQTKYGWAASKL